MGKKPNYQVETSCIHVTEMLDDLGEIIQFIAVWCFLLLGVSLEFMVQFSYQCVFFIFLGDILYVPKPPKTGESVEWRKCYSRGEKDLFKKIDGANECRKHCVRITKALFEQHSNDLFKGFTSYCIKTVAFQLKDNKEINWREENLGECIMLFLKKILKHLEENNLSHTFEPTINLLEGIKCDRLSSALKNKLTSERTFLEWLDSPSGLKTYFD